MPNIRQSLNKGMVFKKEENKKVITEQKNKFVKNKPVLKLNLSPIR